MQSSCKIRHISYSALESNFGRHTLRLPFESLQHTQFCVPHVEDLKGGEVGQKLKMYIVNCNVSSLNFCTNEPEELFDIIAVSTLLELIFSYLYLYPTGLGSAIVPYLATIEMLILYWNVPEIADQIYLFHYALMLLFESLDFSPHTTDH